MGADKTALLLTLMAAVVYTLFVHDRVDFSLLPWNHSTGGKQSWDEILARQATLGLDQEVTAAELFPSPPSALEANGRVVEPPKDQADLEGWLRKVKLSHEFEEANKTAVDKWMTEALFFIDLRNNQERDWLLLEKDLNALYGWFNGFYNDMLASKMHVNTMHEAPPAPPPAPEELSPSASNVPELKEVDALIEDEEKNHQDIAAKYKANDTAGLLELAGMLNKRITSEEQSIAFIRNKIRGFVKAHGGHAKSINDAKQDKLGKCEDDTEIRRQTFLELHTFLDSIFQHMSEGLEAARVEALQIRNSPTDSRTAAEEVSAMRVYLSRRDPSLSHMLAQVMPELHHRAAGMMSLNATLHGLKQQAKDIDGLMKTTSDIAGLLLKTFKGVYQSSQALQRAQSLLDRCRGRLETFTVHFEVTMKQRDVAYKLVQLANGLASVKDNLHTSMQTVEGVAQGMQSLDGLDEEVKREAQAFKELAGLENDLNGVVNTVVTFVNGCATLVKGADLNLTAGRAKIMNYYATHRIHRETSDGIPAKLKQVDTKDPHPPAAIKEVIYDFKIAQASLAARDWWKASPPPPTLPPHIG